MMTETERLARIGELLRLRGWLAATHEEQLRQIDDRLRTLYPPEFLQLLATAEAQGQGQDPPDFLEWYARQKNPGQ